MSLDWKPHPAVSQCERAGNYQVSRQDGEAPGLNWYAVRFDAEGTVIIGKVRTKQIAKAVCVENWVASGAAPRPAGKPDRPDNYAIPPFEPSGDNEWDERARGGVDKGIPEI